MKLLVVSALIALVHVQHEYDAEKSRYNAIKWRVGFTPKEFEPSEQQRDDFNSNLRILEAHLKSLPVQPTPEVLADKHALALWGIPLMDHPAEAEWHLINQNIQFAKWSRLGQDLMCWELGKLDWPDQELAV